MDGNESLARQQALDKLTFACGAASLTLLICERCGDPADGCRQFPKHYWAMQLACSRCCREWLVCKTCHSLRRPLLKLAAINKHNRSAHTHSVAKGDNDNQKPGETRRREDPPSILSPTRRRDFVGTPTKPHECGINSSTESDYDSNVEMAMEDDHESCVEDPDVSQLTFDFGRKASTVYFRNEFHGRGAEGLVSLASFSQFDPSCYLGENQVSMHITMANLVSRISRHDRDLLGDTLAKVQACVLESSKLTPLLFGSVMDVAN